VNQSALGFNGINRLRCFQKTQLRILGPLWKFHGFLCGIGNADLNRLFNDVVTVDPSPALLAPPDMQTGHR
jgi:hypothetical protein